SHQRSRRQTLWTGAATLLLGALLLIFSGGQTRDDGVPPPASGAQEPCPVAERTNEVPCPEAPTPEAPDIPERRS
ncbi:MAG: hypothetical protein KDD47_06440, partial [Acidobacteria bacterium]|nr:hypothetical protein [Acidobacteriota bacterium]